MYDKESFGGRAFTRTLRWHFVLTFHEVYGCRYDIVVKQADVSATCGLGSSARRTYFQSAKVHRLIARLTHHQTVSREVFAKC